MWGSFHFDDYSLFSSSLWPPPQTRPLTYLTFWANFELGGRNPIGYLAVNLCLHLLAIVVLCGALPRLVPKTAAWIAAAVFAVHPFQAEPVNYVFARSTLLATLLCLVSLADWTRGRHWLAVAWFGAALLAKEECVAFPVFLLMLHFVTSRKRAELKPIAIMFTLSIVAGVNVLLAGAKTAGSGIGVQAGISWHEYALAQSIVILRYLRMLLLPWGFTVDSEIAIPSAWIGAAAWALVLALVVAALFRFRRAQAGFFFIAGLVLLLPSSSFFPANDLAADRRMYLPMIGFATCAGLLLERARPSIVRAALVVLVCLSFVRTSTWRTEAALWSDAVRKAPSKVRPKIQLARAVEPSRGLEILNEAQLIAPADPAIASEKGRIYMSLRQPGQALVEFGRALALAPRSADAFNNRGVALLGLGQKDIAQQDFERALAIDPCQFDARLNLLRMGFQKSPAIRCRYSAEQSAALAGN